MADYLIRPAGPRDLEAVAGLLEQVLRLHHAGRPDIFRAEGRKYDDQELLEIFSNPETPVFVYDKEGAVLGYAFCAIRYQEWGCLQPLKTLYLDDLCVNEKVRGQGIGKALFSFVKEFAREKGCHNISLHVWECNPEAKAFYESMGLSPQYTSMEWIVK